MPELPEVETSLRGILPHLQNQQIEKIILRRQNLRFPMPLNLNDYLKNQKLLNITRRGKYLLFHFEAGTLLLHLGMSGRLRIMPVNSIAEKHDHVDICFKKNTCLRFTDPRRFGVLLFTTEAPNQHPLLRKLGKEPLGADFKANYLAKLAYNKKRAVKNFIMDSQVVVGVGNIYASEALFLAGIHPEQRVCDLRLSHWESLVRAIKIVLRKAIKKGGTSLRDFFSPSGEPGYFRIELNVYGRQGKDCIKCGKWLSHQRIGQRSTVFCASCQPRIRIRN